MKRRMMITGGVTLLAALGASGTANAEESADAARERIQQSLEKYETRAGDDGLPRVDLEAARGAGEAEEA